MICAFVGTIWGGAATSYNSLLGARILQGFGVSMFESGKHDCFSRQRMGFCFVYADLWNKVMFAVIGDLYYVHERGTRVAALTIAISGVANLLALLSGLITDRLGWRWNFWMLAIFLGLGLGLVLLFAWETAFERQEEAVSSDIDPHEVSGLGLEEKFRWSHDSIFDLTLASSEPVRKPPSPSRPNPKQSRTSTQSTPQSQNESPSCTVCLHSRGSTPRCLYGGCS
jgi:MFS family permease